MSRQNQSERIARRRELVAEAHLRGRTASAIAHELTISRSTVRRDLQVLRNDWREARLAATEAADDLELARLALLEREAWSGWERSQQQLVSEKLSKAEDEPSAASEEKRRAAAPAKKRAERGTRSQHGDPRYLMLIMKCLERRSRLLAADAPSQATTIFSAQLTVREVLDQLTDDNDFLTFCRDRSALLTHEPATSTESES
ncbi:MAG: HTH domain-containing protein [Pirellulaceae bacterium]